VTAKYPPSGYSPPASRYEGAGLRAARGLTRMRNNGTTHEVPGSGGKARRNGTRVSHVNGNGHVELATDRVDERKLLEVLTSLRKGNFALRLPVKWTGIAGKVADTLNEIMEINQRMAKELERLARVVGKEGKIEHRVSLSEFPGLWAAPIASV